MENSHHRAQSKNERNPPGRGGEKRQRVYLLLAEKRGRRGGPS